jgi:signal peptidase II
MTFKMDWLSKEKMTRQWTWGLPLVAGVIALDQVSKALVLGEPKLNAMGCLPNTIECGRIELSPVFDLTMTWNRGVSFGALQAEGIARWGLFIVTAAIAIGFTLWLLRASRKLTALALALVIGGAIGNLVDRARFGAVVDFLDFSGLFFPWIFNVADAAISVGAVLLLLDQLLAGRKPAG